MKLTKVLFAAIAAVSIVSAQICTVSAAGLQICYDGATHWYTGEVYSLVVNGNYVQSAMEPIIFNDHALVPVREIFEECGATVDYTLETQCVEINYNDTNIRMHINDNYAYVNGKKQIIPDNVVPKLINKPGDVTKTMVPVRFISETAGMDVEFDSQKGEIIITSEEMAAATPAPEPVVEPVQTNVSVTNTKYIMLSDTSMKLTIKGDGNIKDRVSSFTLTDPERVVVDFAKTGLVVGEETINVGVNGISSIRSGYNDERARIVVDVENLIDYSVNAVDETTIEIIINVTGETSQKTEPPEDNIIIGNESSAEVPPSNASGMTEENSKKIIMLDPGHGGADPGAVGYLDGKAINEKDLTLSIAYKVKSILEADGYITSMTRTGDTLPSLTERPEQANSENCALFVSIHINAAEAENAYGTEVYYSEENNTEKYGVTSKEFADNILSGMLKYMGSYDRGVKMANWAVIRRSNMPAILLEVGFISNQAELRKMCDDEYQNKVAKGIAEGIVNTISEVKMP